MRKKLAGLLVLCMLLSMLGGCGEKAVGDILNRIPLPTAAPEAAETPNAGPEQESEPEPEPTEEPAARPSATPEPEVTPAPAPVGGGYFADVWRADLDFSELEYERYDLSWLKEYTEPIVRMAENGGSPEEFADADYALNEEILYIYTMYQLADLAWCRDPSDRELTEESDYAYEVYVEAYDEYLKAMSIIAASENSHIMSEVYAQDYIDYFASFDEEASQQQNQLILKESQLVNQYYALMSERFVDYDAAVELYVELVGVRKEIAAMAGYDDYAEYAYSSVFYRDYLPEDVEGIWEGVKENFAPIVREFQDRVWDGTDRIISSDLDTSSEAVLNALGRVLPQIAPELNEAYEYMMDYHLYDIDHDAGKAEMGFTTTLYYVNQPFVFNAAYDEFYDYTDMIHEFGHFANAYANMSDFMFGMSDIDLCELQSQGLEMLFTRFYDEIFGAQANDLRSYTLMSMVYSVVDGAMHDEFQQRVYSEDELDAQRVREIFAELYEDYGYTPYYGYEDEWVDVMHNFEYPFYYISYGVSALGALQIYEMMQEDWAGAVDTYMRVCAMDTEYYYFSEAVDEAGLEGVFDPESYDEIAESLVKALGKRP